MRRATKTMLLICIALLAIMILPSCRKYQPVAYSNFVDVDPKGWWRGYAFEYFPAPLDTNTPKEQRYDVLVTVRHTPGFEGRNLWLALEQRSGSNVKRDTICLNLNSQNGKRQGIGSTNLYEVTDTVMRNIQLPSDYSINITHAMQHDVLAGINNVGVVLLKH